MYLRKLNTQKILDCLLSVFCFILVVDPPNVIFKIKDVVFVAIVVISFFLHGKVRIDKLCVFLAVYFVLVITFLRGMAAGYDFDYDYTQIYFKAFSPLLLLCWVDRIELLKKMTFPCVTIGVITLLIVYAMFYLSETEAVVYDFMRSHDDFIIMSHRYFLGMEFVSVFYRTVPLVIMPCSIFCYKMLTEVKSRKRNFLIFSILALTLFFSGTRANMMSVLFIVTFFVVMRMNKGMLGRIISFLLLCIVCVLAFFLLIMLLSEKSESSNVVKFAHLISYMDLFDENWDILIFGQGIGSLFYSEGFQRMVAQTEWTYIEIIRYFGLFGGIFIISIFLYPLYLLYTKRYQLKYALPFGIGYFFYLCIAGTNPLLTSSTGMLALLMAYSYTSNPSYEERVW